MLSSPYIRRALDRFFRHGEAPLLNAVRGKIPETDGPLGRKRRWHRSRNSECDEVCADLDLVCKCAMYGTLLCNLDQLPALRFVQWPDQFNAAQNAINPRLWILTVCTVIGMDPFVSKPHDDLFKSPLFPNRVQIDRHRGATAKRHQ